MREELVRSDEEKQRYRQLVETNRRRRGENFKSDDEQKQQQRTTIAQVEKNARSLRCGGRIFLPFFPF